MIRGAVAFALVLNIKDDWEHKDVIVSSTIMLIIISTILFGSTTALAGKFLLGDAKLNSSLSQINSQNDSKMVVEYV